MSCERRERIFKRPLLFFQFEQICGNFASTSSNLSQIFYNEESIFIEYDEQWCQALIDKMTEINSKLDKSKHIREYEAWIEILQDRHKLHIFRIIWIMLRIYRSTQRACMHQHFAEITLMVG